MRSALKFASVKILNFNHSIGLIVIYHDQMDIMDLKKDQLEKDQLEILTFCLTLILTSQLESLLVGKSSFRGQELPNPSRIQISLRNFQIKKVKISVIP